MTEGSRHPVVRRTARALARGLAVVPAIAVTFAASSAFADAPDTWANNPSVPPLKALLVYAVFPIALFVLITLLVYLPSMSKAQSYRPGQPWRHEAEWFGGPRGGVDAVAAGTQHPGGHHAGSAEATEPTRGGASGRW